MEKKWGDVNLGELLREYEEEKVKKIIQKFKSRDSDIKNFLHNKAIDFEKRGVSKTYLLFNNFNNLVGYFSLSSRNLIVSNENYSKLSKTQQKQLFNGSYKLENYGYVVSSCLIGQLGKNYNFEDEMDGVELLKLSYEIVTIVAKYINLKYIWLECKNEEKLLNFYKNFGFKHIEKLRQNNDLEVLMLKL